MNLKNGIGFGTTEFHVVRPKPALDNYYLYYLTRSYPFRTKGEANMIGSAGQKRIPTLYIKRYRFALPSLKEQRRITHILITCDKEISGLQSKVALLVKKKEGLTQQLIKGQLRVKTN